MQASDFQKLMFPNYAPAPFIPVRGAGVQVWDDAGRDYWDLGGGIAVLSIGHCHPSAVNALQNQAQKLWHVSNLFTNEPALQLAEQLLNATFAERAFFCNSGAEANEAALKLARRHAVNHSGGQKFKIISTKNAFHGRTLFTVTAGGQPKYSDGFGPLPAGVQHIDFNDVAALEAAVDEDVCAIILEPIQGESGVLPATHEFLQAARAAADRVGALLIFDEVQTGCGRTGKLFAYQHFGVEPDILTTAKGLGGGFPIGVTLTRAKIAENFTPGTHGTTYGGNPLACAVGSAVLTEIDRAETYANIAARSQQLRARLQQFAEKYGVFSEVRGMGLLIGAVLTEPYRDQASQFVAAAAQAGVLILQAGTNVLRFAPSLLIQENELNAALDRLETIFQA